MEFTGEQTKWSLLESKQRHSELVGVYLEDRTRFGTQCSVVNTDIYISVPA